MEVASARYSQEMNRGDGSIPLALGHMEVKTSPRVRERKQPRPLRESSFPEELYVNTK
jgi:hypothetical protein